MDKYRIWDKQACLPRGGWGGLWSKWRKRRKHPCSGSMLLNYQLLTLTTLQHYNIIHDDDCDADDCDSFEMIMTQEMRSQYFKFQWLIISAVDCKNAIGNWTPWTLNMCSDFFCVANASPEPHFTTSKIKLCQYNGLAYFSWLEMKLLNSWLG